MNHSKKVTSKRAPDSASVTITTEEENEQCLREIEKLMAKGERNLTKSNAKKLESLALAVQQFEKQFYKIKKPKTLIAMVELRMFEKGLKRTELANIMGLSNSKLSNILNNKRKPDVQFLKAAHDKLGIDGEFLLTHV